MSEQKSKALKKLAAGATLVALSGFVPQPLVSPAMADTATINAAGTFAGGITMTPGVNVAFGSMVANGNTGTFHVTTGGGTNASNGFFNGAVANGSILFNAAAGGLSVDVTVAGYVAAQALSDKGEGTQGSITLGTVTLAGPFAAPAVIKSTAPSKQVLLGGTTGAARTTDIDVGTIISWSGARPIGGFSLPLTVTIAY